MTPTLGGERVRLSVLDPSRRSLVRRFTPVHERLMHVFIVAAQPPDGFRHEHPVQQPDGTFVLDLPRVAGSFMLFAHFLPAGGTPQMFQQFIPSGSMPRRGTTPELTPATRVEDGLRVSIETTAVKSGGESPLTFTVADAASGTPVTDLEPFLGAGGHLFVASADLTEARYAQPADDGHGPTIAFSPIFPRPGRYSLWLQIQRAGHVTTVPFVIEAGAASAHDPIATTATFSPEIRAILETRCTACHSRGGPAPMPLTTYEEVQPWARAIKEQVLTRRMPIWHAARGYGAFVNDPTLTPFEVAQIVAWVDGGLPRGTSAAAPASRPRPRPSSGFIVPAGATEFRARVRHPWITGWTFLPGDPLITAVTIEGADGAPIGAWVAGDSSVRLPAGSAMRIVSPLRIQIRRRPAADYERDLKLQPSRLRVRTLASAPRRRVRIERAGCGSTLGAPESIGQSEDARILAVRPVLAPGASAMVSFERIAGAPPVLAGWFRDFDPNYARTYWLARPIDFAANARVTSDAPCALDVVLSTSRTPRAVRPPPRR